VFRFPACYSEIVRRKRTPAAREALPDTIVPELVVEQAHSVLEVASKKPSKCVVCAEECAINSTEGLCWVCRRLKFSAWRDSDTQMPAQE